MIISSLFRDEVVATDFEFYPGFRLSAYDLWAQFVQISNRWDFSNGSLFINSTVHLLKSESRIFGGWLSVAHAPAYCLGNHSGSIKRQFDNRLCM
jgi:hypothetical protein